MPDFFVKEKPAATGPVNVEIFSINRLRRQQGFKLGVHEVGKFSQRYFLSIPFELVDQFMQTYNCGNYQNFVGRKAQAYLDQQQVVGISMDAFFANYNKKTHLEVKLEAFDVEKEFVELDAQLLDVKGSVRESDNYKLLQLVWSLTSNMDVQKPLDLVHTQRVRWLHALGRPPYSADFFKKSFSVMLQDGKYVGATYGEVAQKSAPSRRSREVEEEKVKYDLMWDGKPYLLHAECRSDLIRMAPRIGRMGLTMQDGLEKVLQMAPVGARYVDPSSPHRQTIVFGTNPYLRQMIIYDNTILDVSVASSMR